MVKWASKTQNPDTPAVFALPTGRQALAKQNMNLNLSNNFSIIDRSGTWRFSGQFNDKPDSLGWNCVCIIGKEVA